MVKNKMPTVPVADLLADWDDVAAQMEGVAADMNRNHQADVEDLETLARKAAVMARAASNLAVAALVQNQMRKLFAGTE